jgi:hypothetical protein
VKNGYSYNAALVYWNAIGTPFWFPVCNSHETARNQLNLRLGDAERRFDGGMKLMKVRKL